jgi:hypothetical protein
MIAIVKEAERVEFEKLCRSFDLLAMEMDRHRGFLVYDIYGDQLALFTVGYNLGVRVGIQYALNECSTIKLN